MGERLKRCMNNRDMAMPAAVEQEETGFIFSKRRKLCFEEEISRCVDLNFSENAVSPTASGTYGCSEVFETNDPMENIADLSSEFFPEVSSSVVNSSFRYSVPATRSELFGDLEKVLTESSTTWKKSSAVNSRRSNESIAAETMLYAAEIEAFFAAAEDLEQKRFASKYNYDTVKDIPLEGKYHWVPLHEP